MYQVLSFTVFSFVSYMHIHMPLRMYWPRLFFVVFQEIQCLPMTMFVTSRSFISLPEADHVRPSTALHFSFPWGVRRGVRRANRNAKRREERRAETVRDGSLWSFVAKVCLPVSYERLWCSSVVSLLWCDF